MPWCARAGKKTAMWIRSPLLPLYGFQESTLNLLLTSRLPWQVFSPVKSSCWPDKCLLNNNSVRIVLSWI